MCVVGLHIRLYVGYKRSIVSMGSVATLMIVLIMKLMPQIKLCVIYKYGNVTYKTRL